MKVAVGKNEHGITYLDLHENAYNIINGPALLITHFGGSADDRA